MAVNQPDCKVEGNTCSEWDPPTWPSGGRIAPKARQVEDMHKWKVEHDDITDQVANYEGGCISMGNVDR